MEVKGRGKYPELDLTFDMIEAEQKRLMKEAGLEHMPAAAYGWYWNTGSESWDVAYKRLRRCFGLEQ